MTPVERLQSAVPNVETSRRDLAPARRLIQDPDGLMQSVSLQGKRHLRKERSS